MGVKTIRGKKINSSWF